MTHPEEPREEELRKKLKDYQKLYDVGGKYENFESYEVIDRFLRENNKFNTC